jgi:acyl-CoA thioesterase-2
MAAARTARNRMPLSLHALFVRPGDVTIPVEYGIETVRDGRTIAVRRVSATQHGLPILDAMASFGSMDTLGKRSDEGWTAPDYQRAMPTVTAPESLPRIEVQLAPYAQEFDGWWVRPRPFDMRYVTPPPRIAMELPQNDSRLNQLWLRADGRVPADPLLNCCLITYVSDLTLLDPVMIAARRTSRGPGFTASLDHSLWFHRPARLDDWMLYDQFSSSATQGRGLVSAAMFNRSGELACVVSQEGYLAAARHP